MKNEKFFSSIKYEFNLITLHEMLFDDLCN